MTTPLWSSTACLRKHRLPKRPVRSCCFVFREVGPCDVYVNSEVIVSPRARIVKERLGIATPDPRSVDGGRRTPGRGVLADRLKGVHRPPRGDRIDPPSGAGGDAGARLPTEQRRTCPETGDISYHRL